MLKQKTLIKKPEHTTHEHIREIYDHAMLNKLLYISKENKMKIKVLLILFTLTISGNASAAIEMFTSKLTKVASTWTADGVVIEVESPLSTSCSSTKLLMSSTGNNMFKENLSILLSAFHATSNVQLSIDGCNGSHINLIAVGVYK